MNISAPLITIKPLNPDHQADAVNLILAGLEEHWGILDKTKNPDLEDLCSSYAQGAFLLAWLDGEIVGTGAYLPQSPTVVEIRRMSVAKHLRRKGIGSRMLNYLCQHARREGHQKAILETTRAWEDVIAFYLAFGFNFSHFRGDDAYFTLELK
jgi:GNAT superfamily N-acetyltransferase